MTVSFCVHHITYDCSAGAKKFETPVSKLIGFGSGVFDSDYLDAGCRTADIMSDGMALVGCSRCGELVAENLRKE